MVVHPSYQRRGLGQRLMKQALLDADRDGARTFLCASNAGKNLYAKNGFRDLECRVLDLVHLGASGLRKTTAQMREPQPVTVVESI
jgi:GNAT superfamily N-acetyltransferase